MCPKKVVYHFLFLFVRHLMVLASLIISWLVSFAAHGIFSIVLGKKYWTASICFVFVDLWSMPGIHVLDCYV